MAKATKQPKAPKPATHGTQTTATQPALTPELELARKPDTADTGTNTNLPAWLRQQIETQHPNTFGRLAGWHKCPRCKAWTLAGWEALDDYAGHATVDPLQLDTLNETRAILAGRTTYELIIENTGAKTLRRREQHGIAAKPATTHRYPILPAHKCGQPLGAPIPQKQFTEGNN